MKPIFKTYSLLIVSALCFTLSFPPYSLTPLVFVAFIPLFILQDSWEEEGASFFGMASKVSPAFLLFCILSFWWVKNASWIGLVAGALYNCILMSVAFSSRFLFKNYRGRSLGNLGFVAIWICLEYLHLNFFALDFPWLVLGNSFAEVPQIVQWYELTGVLGGSIWVLISNLSLYSLYKRLFASQERSSVFGRAVYSFLILTIPLLASLYTYRTYQEDGVEVNACILQPNVDPYGEKWISANYKEQMRMFTERSASRIDTQTSFLIWPETSVPGYLYFGSENWQEEYFSSLQSRFPNLNILVGCTAVRRYQDGDSLSLTHRTDANGVNYDVYNAAFYYPSEGEREHYYKSKLVIGVEKMPFVSSIPWLKKLVVDLGGTSGQLGFQEEREVFFNSEGIGIAPAICYESIFGSYCTEYVKKGAGIIAVITNDGWWGDTPGYKQHFQFARLRAIENRRPILRSANTGISGAIDQRGAIIHGTEYWVPDALNLSVRAGEQITFYTKHGDYLGRFALIISALLLLISFVQKKL
jgi:apolipoprotein N-acyltransferase